MIAKPTLFIAALLPLAACVTQYDPPPDGVIMPSLDEQSWGVPDASILFSDSTMNDDGTRTVTVQFYSSAVSDDDLGMAPGLICAPDEVLTSDVRLPTATEALGDGTLMLIVTCGA